MHSELGQDYRLRSGDDQGVDVDFQFDWNPWHVRIIGEDLYSLSVASRLERGIAGDSQRVLLPVVDSPERDVEILAPLVNLRYMSGFPVYARKSESIRHSKAGDNRRDPLIARRNVKWPNPLERRHDRRWLRRWRSRSVRVRLEENLKTQTEAGLFRIVGCDSSEFRYFALIPRRVFDR